MYKLIKEEWTNCLFFWDSINLIKSFSVSNFYLNPPESQENTFLEAKEKSLVKNRKMRAFCQVGSKVISLMINILVFWILNFVCMLFFVDLWLLIFFIQLLLKSSKEQGKWDHLKTFFESKYSQFFLIISDLSVLKQKTQNKKSICFLIELFVSRIPFELILCNRIWYKKGWAILLMVFLLKRPESFLFPFQRTWRWRSSKSFFSKDFSTKNFY